MSFTSISYILSFATSKPAVVRSSTGVSVMRSRPLFRSTSTMLHFLGSPFSYPQRKFDILSRGACVAERPILTKPGDSSSSLSRFRDRSVPLLDEETSCISSTITYFTSLNFSLNFGAVSESASDSGVVINMCGGFLSIFCLSFCVVSPLLRPTLIFGRFMLLSSAIL